VKVIHHLSLLRLDEIGCEWGSEMAGREHVLRRVGRVVRSSGGSEVIQDMRRFYQILGPDGYPKVWVVSPDSTCLERAGNDPHPTGTSPDPMGG
jgi:hypothetical protein